MAGGAMRAARWMSAPTYVPSASSAPSPVWRPIRTLIGASSGQGSAASARWASTAAAIARSGCSNTAKNESPSVCTSWP